MGARKGKRSADRGGLPVQSRRLRQAREAAGLSQKILGIQAGLDQPHVRTMQRLADVLGLPLPYFYAEDDGLARLIANYRPKRSPGN